MNKVKIWTLSKKKTILIESLSALITCSRNFCFLECLRELFFCQTTFFFVWFAFEAYNEEFYKEEIEELQRELKHAKESKDSDNNISGQRNKKIARFTGPKVDGEDRFF